MIDRKFLDDKEHYADDMDVMVGDMKVKLGDLRAYDIDQRTNLDRFTKRTGQLEGEYGKLANQYNELRALYDQVAQQLQAYSQNPPKNAEGDLVDQLVERLRGEKNPTVMEKGGEFFAPLLDRVKKIDEIEANQNKFKEDLRKELVSAFGFQVNKDMKRDFRAFNWPKEWTFQKVLEYANEHQILEPGSRYPDFDRIHDNIMAPINAETEREELRKAAREEGYAQARKELTQDGAYVPNPGFGGLNGTSPLKSKFGGIDKIPDETILNDPDIWSQIPQ
jgi:archaellum component FlaC